MFAVSPRAGGGSPFSKVHLRDPVGYWRIGEVLAPPRPGLHATEQAGGLAEMMTGVGYQRSIVNR